MRIAVSIALGVVIMASHLYTRFSETQKYASVANFLHSLCLGALVSMAWH